MVMDSMKGRYNMAQIKVTVGEFELREGRRESTHSCPIALALAQRFPDAKDIYVGYIIATVDGLSYYLSKAASRSIERSDHDKANVKPATFILRST